MKTKEIIEIVLAASSLIISFVAIWQARVSIKLTEKSIRDSNRPYIGINIDYIDTVYFEKFLVFKNFGNTSAKILNLEFINGNNNHDSIKNNLQSLVGGEIMPGQKFTTSLDDDFNEDIEILLLYKGLDGVEYTKQFNIKTSMGNDLMWHSEKLSSDSDVATAIKLGSQAISKTLK